MAMTLENALELGFRAGFIRACNWPAPVSQDVDSPAFAADLCQFVSLHTPLTPHLTQPAQAVDVGAIREVIDALKGSSFADGRFCKEQVDKLTRALAGEQAGWRDMDSAPKDGTRVMLTNGHGVWMGEYLAFYTSGARADEWVSAMLNHDHIERSHRHDKPTGWRPLPASPTPDKETQR